MEYIKKLFVTKTTQRAVLVELENRKETWLPRTQVKLDDSENYVIGVKSYFAEKNGITEDDVEFDESIGVTAVVKKSDKEKVIVKCSGKSRDRKLYTRKSLNCSVFLDNNAIFTIPKNKSGSFDSDNGLKHVGYYSNDDSMKVIMEKVSEFYNDIDDDDIDVKTIDIEEVKEQLKKEGVIVGLYEYDRNAKHKEYETIKTCVETDIPVYLYGSAGTGKNYTLKQIAEELELNFYFTNSVQQEYKITGFIDANGDYHETEFYKAFTEGGLFFLDELDASIPEVLVLLNSAIANKYFDFPIGREDAHEDFRVVSAGNTIGAGANELYTGRMSLDGATLDRFMFIEFDYDKQVEIMLAEGDLQLVEFVNSLRRLAELNHIQATFSYRCIINIKKLEGKLELEKVIKGNILKGLDNDSARLLIDDEVDNKYFETLSRLVS